MVENNFWIHFGTQLTLRHTAFRVSKKVLVCNHTEDVYAESYSEHDHLGTIYQRYLDAIENIESSQLSLAEKQMEIERANDTRMKAFLNDGMTKRHIEGMPPWNN